MTTCHARFAALVLVSACAPAAMTTVARERIGFEIQMRIAADANQDYPVAIAMLLVYKAEVVSLLKQTSADQWFEMREDFIREHAAEIDEDVWEFVPGQQVPPLVHAPLPRAAQGVLFLRYRTPGTHRYFFDPRRSQRVVLGPDQVTITPID